MLISSIILGKIKVTIEWAKGNPLNVYMYSIQSVEIIGTSLKTQSHSFPLDLTDCDERQRTKQM